MRQERIALSCGRDFSISEVLGALGILCPELVGQSDCGTGKIEVHPDASVINALIDHELSAIPRAPIPGRQFFVDRAHGLDVQAAVVHKAGPILRIRRAVAHVALTVGLAEFQHEAPAVLVFRLVNAETVNLRQSAQRAGQAVGIRFDHTVIYTLKRNVDMEVFGLAQDRDVEISSVMPNEIDVRSIHFCGGKHGLQLERHSLARCDVPNFCRTVINRIAKQQHLAVFCVLVRAVHNVTGTEGF